MKPRQRPRLLVFGAILSLVAGELPAAEITAKIVEAKSIKSGEELMQSKKPR